MTIADKKRIESVQRRATKMVIEIRSLEYEDRLLELKLTTLEMRRKRGDMIQIYKIFNGIDEVEIGLGISRNEGPYSKHSHNFLIQRVISKMPHEGSFPIQSKRNNLEFAPL